MELFRGFRSVLTNPAPGNVPTGAETVSSSNVVVFCGKLGGMKHAINVNRISINCLSSLINPVLCYVNKGGSERRLNGP